MDWVVYDRGQHPAKVNMDFDSELLGKLAEIKNPSLHFYEFNEKSATYGYFIKPFELFSEKKISGLSIDLARRPTGGGFLFHGQDLTFSIAVPETHSFYSQNPLESYNRINGLVAEAIQKVSKHSELSLLSQENNEAPKLFKNFCMAKPTRYDIFFQGKKIGGAAERKVKFGLLHQASINLNSPWRDWQNLLFEEASLAKAIQANAGSLFTDLDSKNLTHFKIQLKQALKEAFFNTR